MTRAPASVAQKRPHWHHHWQHGWIAVTVDARVSVLHLKIDIKQRLHLAGLPLRALLTHEIRAPTFYDWVPSDAVMKSPWHIGTAVNLPRCEADSRSGRMSMSKMKIVLLL